MEYKYVQRTLTGGASVVVGGALLVQNIAEFEAYMNATYFAKGWELAGAPQLLKYEQAHDSQPEQSQWVYHLVKAK